jgi:hypothetical protein
LKVTTDFLPAEYKSFVFDGRMAGVLLAFAVLSGAVCGTWSVHYKDVLKGLEKEIGKREEEIAALENRINSKSYNQAEIQELIDKFNFIREAVGARDFPYLRFYHAFEQTIPIDEATGARRIAISELTKSRGGRYKVHGLAKHWDDLLRFEQNLNASSYRESESGGEMRNFAEVRMGAWESTDKGVDFTAEFVFTAE